MGAREAEEMLEVAKEQALIDEHRIAALEAKLAAIRHLAAADTITLQDTEDAPYETVEVWKLQRILDTDQ